MAIKQPQLRSPKVIDEEIKPFLQASASHQIRVRRSLSSLRSTSREVFEAFEKRRTAREQTDSAHEAKALQDAQSALEMQTKINEYNVSLGNAELSKISNLNLEIAKGAVEMAKASAKWRRSVTQQADRIDSELQAWLDELVALSASAVSDDTSLEKALALASGGLIIAGVLGGPATALGAAIASAALLARDVAQGTTKTGRAASRDKAELREQQAIVLMDHVSGLCKSWKVALTS